MIARGHPLQVFARPAPLFAVASLLAVLGAGPAGHAQAQAQAQAQAPDQAQAPAPAYDIYQLQHSGPEWDWQSPHQGEIVQCTGGVVTHKFRQRIVLQDPTLGSEWAAIEVRGYPVYPSGIAIGDQVDFDNVYVDEYRGVTTLQYYSASSHVVQSSGNPQPVPVSLSPYSLRYPAHPEDTEKYAAMLVALYGPVTVDSMGLGPHEDNYALLGWSGQIVWGSDYGNTEIDSTYYVSNGECYGCIVGIAQRYRYEGWDFYQLLPRGIEDYTPCGTGMELNAEPRGLRILPIAPNPVRLPATIAYHLASNGEVALEIFDLMGRRVALLMDGWREPGFHAVVWDGAGRLGDGVAAGVYQVRLTADGASVSRRLCLVR